MIQFLKTTISDPKFQLLVGQLDTELGEMYGEQQVIFTPHNILKDDTFALVVLENDEPIGIGAFRAMDEEGVIEIKRMFVPTAHRGKGISKLILQKLENWVSEKGFNYSKLETGDKNLAAISLYLKSGYQRIKPFGPYTVIENSLCFGKKLK